MTYRPCSRKGLSPNGPLILTFSCSSLKDSAKADRRRSQQLSGRRLRENSYCQSATVSDSDKYAQALFGKAGLGESE